MKSKIDELDAEQSLKRLRMAEPSPELRARVLAAARQEWQKPVPVSAWQPFRRPLLAIAASLVIAAAGSWMNSTLVSLPAVASTSHAEEPQWKELEIAGLPIRLYLLPGAGAIRGEEAIATLELHLQQMNDMLNPRRNEPAIPASGGQTKQFRQKTMIQSSSC